MNKINLKGITPEAIAGILILFVALINAILQMCGINTLPIESEEINTIVSTAFLIITALYNAWKNRNVTTLAQKMQIVTDAIRNGELLEDEVTTLIEKINRNKTE